jgi:hypothetical protein
MQNVKHLPQKYVLFVCLYACLSAIHLASHCQAYEHSHKKHDFEENYRLSAIADEID